MRYLIIKTSAFGDIVHAYGVLEYIKQVDPECEVDWLVEKRMKDLVESHPDVARTITVDTKKWRKNLCWKEVSASLKELRKERYDAVFDLQGNVKSAILTFLTRAGAKVGFGFKTAPESISAISYTHRYNPPVLQNVRDDYLFLAKCYFKVEAVPSFRLLNAKAVSKKDGWLICPGSNWKNKQLTFETLLGFLEYCRNAYSSEFIFLAGNEPERVQAEELVRRFNGSQILYKPALSDLQHIMDGMQLVISMDSLPLHLAGTTRVPTFSFFGPSSSHKFNPPGPTHGSFQGPCPYGVTFEKRCPRLRSCPTGACLREVSAETLFSAFQSLFRGG